MFECVPSGRHVDRTDQEIGLEGNGGLISTVRGPELRFNHTRPDDQSRAERLTGVDLAANPSTCTDTGSTLTAGFVTRDQRRALSRRTLQGA